ncbi:MAG: hypothetical protein OXI96_09595 [Acidimicrobiaceae bacterium]|nr:hypothetical protein [Acidimicrobiaceae bacterium]
MELAEFIITAVIAFAAISGVVLTTYKILSGKFDRVDAKFDKVDAKFDKVDAKFDKVYSKLDKILDELGKLNVAVTRIDTQQQEHEKKLDAMSTHSERLAVVEDRTERYAQQQPTQQPVEASATQLEVSDTTKQTAAA